MSLDNGEKSKHGYNAQTQLSELLKFCKDKNYIKEIITNYRIGKSGYKNEEQFYAPFLVTFFNNESWILFSATSMRTDRVKGQQWDSYNLKEINHNITKSFLVYPDGVNNSELNNFHRQDLKYQEKEEYSAIDAIIDQNKLHDLIEEKATANLSKGSIKDLQGRSFEDRIAQCLSNSDNLGIWKRESKTLSGLYYSFFKTIIDYLGFNHDEIVSINATVDKKVIGKLPTGGNPKTDILVTINLQKNKYETITISCKRSSKDKVSVHEYTADTFSRVLDVNNRELSKLLHLFQQNPTLSSFGEENVIKLTSAIAPYKNRLAKWVFAGVGGNGDPNTQWATHILTYDNNDNTISFHSIDEYIKLLNSTHAQGNFGTFFSWTYPSKKRGKSIQLKCKIIK